MGAFSPFYFCGKVRLVLRSRFLLLLLLMFIHINPVFAQQSCGELNGTVERVTYDSDIAEMEMVYSVYLPPCYAESGETYPVIYLMHGSNNDHNQWLRFLIDYEIDRGILRGELPPLADRAPPQGVEEPAQGPGRARR